MSRVFVISVSGPQGSGKTTLALALGNRLGAPTLSRDPLMAALKDSGYAADSPKDLHRLSLAGYRLQGVLIDQLLGRAWTRSLPMPSTASLTTSRWSSRQSKTPDTCSRFGLGAHLA